MTVAAIGISLAFGTCAVSGQVGHIKLGTVCTVHGSVKLRYTLQPTVTHVPKVGEDLYMDEQAFVPKGCQFAYKDQANEVEPIPATAAWSALRKSQPQAVAAAQSQLNATLDAAVKPRGANGFLIPGSLPVSASLFRIQTLRSEPLLSVKVLAGPRVIYSQSGHVAATPAGLAKALLTAQRIEPDPSYTLVVTTAKGRLKTTFALMPLEQDKAEVAALKAADENQDPVARHVARATEFAKLGWYSAAADELDLAVRLSVGPNQALNGQRDSMRRIAQ